MDVVTEAAFLGAPAFTYGAMIGMWRLIEGSWPKHVVRVAKKFKPKKRVKPAPVNAIEDLANFKKSMRTRQREEWEDAYLALCPPRPLTHHIWVAQKQVVMNGYGDKKEVDYGHFREDHTLQEAWDQVWMPWKR